MSVFPAKLYQDHFCHNVVHGHIPFTADIFAVIEGVIDIAAAGWQVFNRKGITWGGIWSGKLRVLGFGCTIAGFVSSLLSLREFGARWFGHWAIGLGFFVGSTLLRKDVISWMRGRRGKKMTRVAAGGKGREAGKTVV